MATSEDGAEQVLDELRPQSWPQEAFLTTPADIAIAGGARGGGKTYGLLMEPLRWVHVKGFGAVIFRRTYPQIMAEGGLWDSAAAMYPQVGGIPKQSTTEWVFPGNVRIKFAHLQHEKNRFDWDGSQIPLIEFDQLEQFGWREFVHLFACNRSTCGVAPYIRATCNPHPDHWLRQFMAWWIDDDSGLPIPGRAGVLRWFIMQDNDVVWGDSEVELIERYGEGTMPRSFTFVPSTVHDNPTLLRANPEYLASLQSLPKVDRERMLGGNWNVREAAGMFFRREWFPVVEAAPNLQDEVRYWDRAATAAASPGAARASWTAGVKMGRSAAGEFFITDVCRFQGTPLEVQQRIRNVTEQDGHGTTIGIEQDPGQAGKAEAEALARMLAGYNVRLNTVRESKGMRARPVSAQAEAGNIKLVRGKWVDQFLREHENFDGSSNCVSDQVDADSGAFYMLTGVKKKRPVRAWGG